MQYHWRKLISRAIFEDWEEERLNITLGRRSTQNTEATIAATTTVMQLVQRSIQPQPPITNLDQLERIFMRGAETQFKANEALRQAKHAKYTKRKNIHLLAFCGLKINELHLLPEIWKHYNKQRIGQIKW